MRQFVLNCIQHSINIIVLGDLKQAACLPSAYLGGRLASPGDALDLDLGVLGGAHGVAVDDDGRLGRHRHRQHRVL